MPALNRSAPPASVRAPVIGAVSTCLVVATVYMTPPIFLEIAQTLRVDPVDARLAFFYVSLTYSLSFFVFGPLSDRFQAKTLATWGTVALVVLLAAASRAQSFGLFIAELAAAGVAAAAIPAATLALMPRIAPPGRAGTYFGVVIAASVAGITVGRSATGIVAGWLGWRSAVLLLALLNAVCLLALAALPRTETADRTTSALDAYRQALRMFTRGRVVRLLGIGALLFFGYLGAVTFLTFRLADPPFGLGASAIGLVSAIGLGALFGAPLSGAMIPRLGARRVVLAALPTALAGILVLAVAPSTPLVAVGLLLVFLGVFSCQPAVLVLLSEAVPAHNRGSASSSYMLTCLCSGSLSTMALGPVWRSHAWPGVITVACAAILAAILLALHATRPRRPQEGDADRAAAGTDSVPTSKK
ncbi:MFS transporter [Streptomyces vilmorinianum]|uniref:MFS transporter n=1 Tax=Streptomyces vilmorinianum TaxID=3051092 RepID=UPI0010FB2B2C|nr:MFS transporter [Streptomyces vilmorinianum]